MLTDEQHIIKAIAEAYLDKLIRELPTQQIRKVLIDNNIISKKGKASFSKKQLINLALEHNLKGELKKKVFRIEKNSWSWPRRITKILKNYKNKFYNFSKSIFAARFGTYAGDVVGNSWAETVFNAPTIEKLLHYFTYVDDPDLLFNSRKRVIFLLKRYLEIDKSSSSKSSELRTYEKSNNKLYWIFFKELQNIFSKRNGKFIHISDIGLKLCGDAAVLRRYSSGGRSMGINFMERIMDFCNKYLDNEQDIQYINSLLDAISVFDNQIMKVSSDNPKYDEYCLTKAISKSLAPLSESEGWSSDTPNYEELNMFFGVDFKSILSTLKNRFYRVFSQKKLEKIRKKLVSKLAPIDPSGCTDLLNILGYYEPSVRRDELHELFPTFDTWIEFKYKSIHGDKDSSLPSKWQNIRRSSKELFYYHQGMFSAYSLDDKGERKQSRFAFDAFTGNVYNVDSKGWELHHIDFNETNNIPDNFLWVMKLIDPDTLQTSHKTVFSNDQEKREYIALGMMIKTAFKHGYAPRCWSNERQAYYYEIIKNKPRRFIDEFT